MLIPLKQGLKQGMVKNESSRKTLCLNVDSIKARIETFVEGK